MSNKISIGNAGEYFVAGELERRGYSVAVPMSNVKDFDLLVIDRDNYKQFAIQVKTTSSNSKRWVLAKKNENLIRDNIVYVFVALNELGTPKYHIVPSEVVAISIKTAHEEWLKTLGKNGQQHKDNSMRIFYDKDDKYLDNWEYLKW